MVGVAMISQAAKIDMRVERARTRKDYPKNVKNSNLPIGHVPSHFRGMAVFLPISAHASTSSCRQSKVRKKREDPYSLLGCDSSAKHLHSDQQFFSA